MPRSPDTTLHASTLVNALAVLSVLPCVLGGTLSATCRSQLTELPQFRTRCSSSDVSEIWVAGSCVDRAGSLVNEGKILLSNDFAGQLSGDASSKCTALCKQEASPLGWQQCAEAGKVCHCRGTARLNYSATQWVEQYVDGSISCTKLGFGESGDTAVMACQCRPVYTGCELVLSTGSANRGCYAHTSSRVFGGSGATDEQCWCVLSVPCSAF